ncbi:acyl carrier protein [Duganella sp. LX20W]|uniref:Acyl carrier protein n=1 Tax=Rugamonas brunnea TaxID=2758569 RepID=A0A7W2ESF2_9BURK|nr:phosphopantetheine-binding protein [Rugamonas brunnea]MBA5637670.1 acyl carrier protein [Rugamonas brunnea]
MEREQLMAAVIATLQTIAPEVSAADLAPDEALRAQVDLDSMDWLNFLIGLHDTLKVDIPEADYGRLRTLNELADYLAARLP